jgi:hypothetical protein
VIKHEAVVVRYKRNGQRGMKSLFLFADHTIETSRKQSSHPVLVGAAVPVPVRSYQSISYQSPGPARGG